MIKARDILVGFLITFTMCGVSFFLIVLTISVIIRWFGY